MAIHGHMENPNIHTLNPTLAKRGVLRAIIVILTLTVLEFPPPTGFETRPQEHVSLFWLFFSYL